MPIATRESQGVDIVLLDEATTGDTILSVSWGSQHAVLFNVRLEDRKSIAVVGRGKYRLPILLKAIVEIQRFERDIAKELQGSKPLIAGLNIPVHFAEIMDGWSEEDGRKAFNDYREAGGNLEDGVAFERFLETWNG